MAWEALESGSQVPAALSGSNCGVYIGISATDHGNSGIEDPASADAYTMSGNALSTAANRISHFLNLHGPSMAIDTACSSSLIAIHQACRSLWNGEVDLALAGGMHLLLSPMPFIGFSAATMVSPTGRSRSFDAKADGYVRGEGGGVILLKPLDDALSSEPSWLIGYTPDLRAGGQGSNPTSTSFPPSFLTSPPQNTNKTSSNTHKIRVKTPKKAGLTWANIMNLSLDTM